MDSDWFGLYLDSVQQQQQPGQLCQAVSNTVRRNNSSSGNVVVSEKLNWHFDFMSMHIFELLFLVSLMTSVWPLNPDLTPALIKAFVNVTVCYDFTQSSQPTSVTVTLLVSCWIFTHLKNTTHSLICKGATYCTLIFFSVYVQFFFFFFKWLILGSFQLFFCPHSHRVLAGQSSRCFRFWTGLVSVLVLCGQVDTLLVHAFGLHSLD